MYSLVICETKWDSGNINYITYVLFCNLHEVQRSRVARPDPVLRRKNRTRLYPRNVSGPGFSLGSDLDFFFLVLGPNPANINPDPQLFREGRWRGWIIRN